MKKLFVTAMCSLLLLGSCDTYTGSGAFAGGSVGSVLGSAIGGLAGGPRGSDMGTIIGMASGAMIGAAVGNVADQRQQQAYDEQSQYLYDRRQTRSRSYDSSQNQVFDSSNSGDDRLYDFNGRDYTGSYSAQKPVTSMPSSKLEELGTRYSYSPSLEIVDARFVDSNEDNVLNRNETCKLIFEVMNRGSQPVYDVVPTVVETTGNKHIYISPSVHVEKIDPGMGVRYTAMIRSDNRLKDGNATFCVSVIHGGQAISKVNEFNIPTRGN